MVSLFCSSLFSFKSSSKKMAGAAKNPEYALTEAQKAQFLEHGFVKIEQCFSGAQAADFTANMWPRLGMSPTDKSTWTAERTNMPWHRKVAVPEFAPKAWDAMCQLLGGADRISDQDGWGDSFIVNLGLPEYNEEDELDLRNDLWGWHNDGDFFVHFLDSPQQALLVIPLWSDIVPVRLFFKYFSSRGIGIPIFPYFIMRFLADIHLERWRDSGLYRWDETYCKTSGILLAPFLPIKKLVC